MSKTRCFTQVQKGNATIQGSGGAYARSVYARHVRDVLGDARRNFPALIEDFGMNFGTAGDCVTATLGRRATSDRQRSLTAHTAPRLPVSAIREIF